MNGQFQVLPVLSPETGGGGASRLQDGRWLRVLAALLFSCLLHVVVLLLLHFLVPARHLGLGAASDGRPYPLSATLLGKKNAVEIAPNLPAQVEVVKEVRVPEVLGSVEEMGRDESPAEVAGVGSAGDAFGLPLPGGPFYLTSQLTSRPQALAEIELPTPEILASGAFGNIIMTLWISAAGEVVDVSVEASELSEAVSTATVEAFRKLRFTPGELDGQAVGVVMKIEATYDNEPFPVR